MINRHQKPHPTCTETLCPSIAPRLYFKEVKLRVLNEQPVLSSTITKWVEIEIMVLMRSEPFKRVGFIYVYNTGKKCLIISVHNFQSILFSL